MVLLDRVVEAVGVRVGLVGDLVGLAGEAVARAVPT